MSPSLCCCGDQLVPFSRVRKTSSKMITKDFTLPTEEDLTVQEINISTPALRAAAFHVGKECEKQNNVRRMGTRFGCWTGVWVGWFINGDFLLLFW